LSGGICGELVGRDPDRLAVAPDHDRGAGFFVPEDGLTHGLAECFVNGSAVFEELSNRFFFQA